VRGVNIVQYTNVREILTSAAVKRAEVLATRHERFKYDYKAIVRESK